MCKIGWVSKIVLVDLVDLVDSMVTTSLMMAIVTIETITIGSVEGMMILGDLTSRYRRCLRHRPLRLRISYRKRMK